MSTAWKTKHGMFRVRRDAPTLAEAIVAAQGLADDVASQVEIAAALMNMPPDAVRSEVLKARGPQMTMIRATAPSRTGAPARSVVVEHRPSRRAVRPALAR